MRKYLRECFAPTRIIFVSLFLREKCKIVTYFKGVVMASRFYALTFVALTGILGMVSPPDLAVMTVQAQTTKDRKAEADRLNNQGIQQFNISQFEAALQSWQQALTIYREIKDRLGEGAALGNLGVAYDSLDKYDKAIEFQLQRLAIARELKDRLGEGNALGNLGIAYAALGKYDKAIEFQLQSLAIARELKDRLGEGRALGNLGITYNSLGKYDKAIEFHLQSLAIARELKDRSGEGQSLGSLGNAYDALGKYDKAIEFHLQHLAIAREIKDRSGEGRALGNLGLAYQALSKYDKAIEFQLQRLAIARELKDRLGEGRALGNLGITYDSLGKYDKAIEFHLQSLAIARELKDRLGEGRALGNLGNAYSSLGKYDKVIDFYLQSLVVKREIKDRLGEGQSLGNLGNAYNSLGKYDKAIKSYLQSLLIAREIKDRNGEGSALGNLGIAYDALGKYDKAIEFYLQSLSIAREIKDRKGEGISLNNLGVAFKSLKHPELAILFYKQSINVHESIRKGIRSLSKDDQQSYLKTVSGCYRCLANLLLKQGRVTEALQVLDLLKTQELEDYLKNVKGNDRTAQGVQLLAPERAISGQLSAISFDKIPELNRDLANKIQQLPKSEINKVPDYLQKLPQGAVLIYPLILSDRLELIIFSTNTLPINRTVKIQKEALETLIAEYRSDLQDYSSQDVKKSSKKLYDILIKPIEADLKQANATSILYAPDGMLRYIPLAALYDGNQWLVEKYRVNNLIAYSLFDPDSKPQANLRIFAGAFGGKNGETRFRFSGLPATIPEVDRIAATFSNTTKLIEQEFTANVTKAKVVGQTIVHFATHAQFQTGSPLDSYVLFGDGSKVTLAEINEWNLKDADLVILSACQTGVGSLGNGSEILGFGYQVQRAGAKASIASLWTVSDGGTQLLMEAFYLDLQKQNISLSTSLRSAQISMIRRPVKQGEINYNHPYYWSAFVLIGNGL
jgi:CHAT domain-containing protein/lipopolysaccharide biosynthesis regulator YciM